MALLRDSGFIEKLNQHKDAVSKFKFEMALIKEDHHEFIRKIPLLK